MKSFVYGIDGGDRRIFDYFDMPFYGQLQQQYVHIPLQEDLLNRGWSEIITGARGVDTGGFYMSPELDGSARLSMKYRMGDVPRLTDIKLLWDVLPDDTRVGVMNVPSLMPVVPVNGFCVGSAGAGISKIETISDELAYPEAVRDYLTQQGYVPDLRLNSTEIDSVDEWFSRLMEMESKRVDCFIELAHRQEIDFGLLIDRATTVVQYLFMSEIVAMMDRDSGKTPDFEPTPAIEKQVRQFYSFVDRNIEKLVNALQPTQFVLTADHGHEPMRHHCNPNAVLEANGLFVAGDNKAVSFASRVAKLALSGLPRKYKRKLKLGMRNVGAMPKTRKAPYQLFDRENTVAFSHYYLPGVYLNDKRFGGPVKEEQAAKLTTEICRIFNEHPLSGKHGITAVPCRDQYPGLPYVDKLPDVRLQMPDTIFTTCLCKEYIEDNPVFGPVPDFEKVGSEMHTGTKGSSPICLVDPATAALQSAGDASDLTLVYKLVSRFFNNAS